MSIDHIISDIYNSNIGNVILIGDSITLLYYIHRFIGSLHTMDNRSQTRSLSCYYLYKILECY